MPTLTEPAWEKFAEGVAHGLSASEAYIQAGYSARGARQSASRLRANPDISLRIQELTIRMAKRVEAGIVVRRITERNARIGELQQRWDELREIYDSIRLERGEAMGAEGVDADGRSTYVAGGSTGFLVQDYKGKDADTPIYRIDVGLLAIVREIRELGRHAAIEMGQWEQKHRIVQEEPQPDLDKLNDEELDILEALLAKAEKKEGPATPAE